MKLLRITGCGDCPYCRRRAINAIVLGERYNNEMVCSIKHGIVECYDSSLIESCLGVLEFKHLLSQSKFIIPGCPLPDAKEEKE
jgi:hypothetical protein